MKLKLNRRRIVILAAVAVAACLILAHSPAHDQPSTGLDDPARKACSDFIGGYPNAATKPARLSLADKVVASSVRSANQLIATRATEMARDAGGTDAQWVAGADAFSSACRSAGWVA